MTVSVAALWARDADLESRVIEQEHQRRHARGWRLFALAMGTLGVVYGDIGTSPLYVYGAVFPDGAPSDERVVLGVASTIFWTLTSIVLVKYIIFTMEADDNGEGGIFALYALICRACNLRQGTRMTEADLSLSQYQAGHRRRGSRVSAAIRGALERSRVLQTALLVVVLLASNMIISDGVLTPAISVVSAVEGIKFQTGISQGAVTGISMGILVLLFALQSVGTQRVSFLFSPLTLMWFICNAALGIYNIARFGGPGIFRALSPHYMYYFWAGHASEAWHSLGNIMLCVTGAEALYADMGHFNALSIRISFLSVVYPSLVVTYLGQTAMIVQNPSTASIAYWESVPDAVVWPMVVLATLAAVIASQALITGAFSIVQQAMAMNAFPRLTIRHTSKHIMGQVYIPEVNWLLLVGALIVVGVFETSSKIGNAYGLAVITVMLLDTSLFVLVALTAWEWNVLAAGAFWAFFSFITGAYLSSNVSKVPKGAWFSLALSAALSCITYLWHWGQTKKLEYVRNNKILLRDLYEIDHMADSAAGGPIGGTGAAAGWRDLIRPSAASVALGSDSGQARAARPLQALRLADSQQPVARVPGIGIYYNELLLGVPPVLERFMSLVPALHEVVIFLTVRVVPVPAVMPQERLLLRRLRFEGFYHVVARYGYQDVIQHDAAFVDAMVQEVHSYLHPATGIADLTAEAAAAHGNGRGLGVHGKGCEDVEAGLGGEGSVHRGALVHVDPSESLTTVSGARVRNSLSFQLFELGRHDTAMHSSPPGARERFAARDDSAGAEKGATATFRHSGVGSGGPPTLVRVSTITAAVPVAHDLDDEEEEEGSVHAGKPGPSMAPWVQMPSQVRRVRARMLGLPESGALPLPGNNPTGLPLDDNLLSLPLPARLQRPPLAPLLDSTVSLPLPRHAQRAQRTPLYRVQRAMEREAAAAADAAAAEGQQGEPGQAQLGLPQATPTSTLTPAAAQRLGQQLWQRLQLGRFQGRLHRTSMESRATAASGAAGAEQQQQQGREHSESSDPVPAGRLGSQDGGRADTVRTEDVLGASAAGAPLDADAARHQLFRMQTHAAESQLDDRYAAERQLLLSARQRGVVYLLGRSNLRAEPGSGWFKTFLLETAYATLVANCRSTTSVYQVPREGLLSLGVDYQL